MDGSIGLYPEVAPAGRPTQGGNPTAQVTPSPPVVPQGRAIPSLGHPALNLTSGWVLTSPPRAGGHLMTLLPPQRVAEEAQASTTFPVQLPLVLPYAPPPSPVFQGPPHRRFPDPSRQVGYSSFRVGKCVTVHRYLISIHLSAPPLLGGFHYKVTDHAARQHLLCRASTGPATPVQHAAVEA
ncbi:hypothetical protein NDU88_006779 [Pleurodeles waltl]|uniref:Uncharacterized protein n=1 Tax=Pleurodeles waltl TaxID=8319 RepID=A0AAV7LRF1_PLEWA|nr:hypothetical protein NDU88_006779 [Pleurodeles waltl]